MILINFVIRVAIVIGQRNEFLFFRWISICEKNKSEISDSGLKCILFNLSFHKKNKLLLYRIDLNTFHLIQMNWIKWFIYSIHFIFKNPITKS